MQDLSRPGQLLTLQTAHCIDTLGTEATRSQIAAIKVVAIQAAQEAVDHAIQLHSSAGASQHTFLPYVYLALRTLRIAHGPTKSTSTPLPRASSTTTFLLPYEPISIPR